MREGEQGKVRLTWTGWSRVCRGPCPAGCWWRRYRVRPQLSSISNIISTGILSQFLDLSFVLTLLLFFSISKSPEFMPYPLSHSCTHSIPLYVPFSVVLLFSLYLNDVIFCPALDVYKDNVIKASKPRAQSW